MREKENLTQLGSKSTEYSMDYAPDVLERFFDEYGYSYESGGTVAELGTSQEIFEAPRTEALQRFLRQ